MYDNRYRSSRIIIFVGFWINFDLGILNEMLIGYKIYW